MDQLSLIIAILFFSGAGLLLLERTRAKDPVFKQKTRRSVGIRKRVQRELRAAGKTDLSPTAFLLVVGAAAMMTYLAFALMLGLVAALFVVPIVFVAAYFYVSTLQRSYFKNSANEMVPFLRKIQSHARAGGNAQSAFIKAVDETKLIGPAIAPIVDQMRMNNRPFMELLAETRQYLPFRIWSTFVRSMEMNHEVGGDLESALDDTVKQINTMIRLRAIARRYYQPMKSQQYFMVGAGIATAPMSILLMGGAFLRMFDSLLGWIMFFTGLAIMLFGMFIARRIIIGVEKRIGD